jgi:DNA-binding response OmpR family regulator
MLDPNPHKVLGTILLVSRDAIASRQVTDAMQQLALSVEVCVDISAVADRLSRNKFEAVVIDLALDQGLVCLERVRSSATNRTAVIFTLTSSNQETAHALNQGSSFVLQRPLTAESIGHTLKVAYGFIVRERRRYSVIPSPSL